MMAFIRGDTFDCPPVDERTVAMQSWKCSELETFDKVLRFYSIEGYVEKGIQMFIFTLLLIFILVKLFQGNKKIGFLSVLIVTFSLLESIFATIRIATLFPFYNNYHGFRVIHSMDDVCFYGATWLFGIKYFETAYDVELIVSTESSKSVSIKSSYDTTLTKSRERKKLFNVIRWTVFGIICISVTSEGISFFHDEPVYVVIGIITFCVNTLVVMGTTAVMFAALTKFIRIVSQQNKVFNRCQIAVQVTGLFIWTVTRITAGIILLIY